MRLSFSVHDLIIFSSKIFVFYPQALSIFYSIVYLNYFFTFACALSGDGTPLCGANGEQVEEGSKRQPTGRWRRPHWDGFPQPDSHHCVAAESRGQVPGLNFILLETLFLVLIFDVYSTSSALFRELQNSLTGSPNKLSSFAFSFIIHF